MTAVQKLPGVEEVHRALRDHGVSKRKVYAWVKAGLPQSKEKGRGRGFRFDSLAAVTAWARRRLGYSPLLDIDANAGRLRFGHEGWAELTCLQCVDQPLVSTSFKRWGYHTILDLWGGGGEKQPFRLLCQCTTLLAWVRWIDIHPKNYKQIEDAWAQAQRADKLRDQRERERMRRAK